MFTPGVRKPGAFSCKGVVAIPAKGQLSGKFIPCEVCGKETYFTPFRVKKNKHFYCSPECSAVAWHRRGTEERTCEHCGRPFVARLSVPQRFCSVECQAEWQRQLVGPLNPRYTSVEHRCDYCGKVHTVRPYKLSQEHLFCSTKCRRDWYANVWSQDDAWRKRSRERAVEILSSGVVSQTHSKPQELVDSMLDGIGVRYTREKPIGTYSIDNYLDDYGLCIEVMGDFWHTNPNKYIAPKYDKQIIATSRDVRKREYIKSVTGCYPLYLWESDIMKRLDMCAALVSKYIEACGMLQNYNSFNYTLDGDDLVLNQNIVSTFQETGTVATNA